MKQKMTYLRYLFSDKKAFIYWIWLVIWITIVTLIRVMKDWNYYNNYGFQNYFNVFFYISFILVLYIGYYTSGYLKYKLQEKFRTIYKSTILHESLYDVEIYQDKVRVKAFLQSGDIKLSLPHKKDYFQICKIDNSIIILGHVYDLGILKRHISPIQIDLDNTAVNKLKFTIKPDISDLVYNNRNLEIKFKKNISQINKLIIKDFK